MLTTHTTTVSNWRHNLKIKPTRMSAFFGSGTFNDTEKKVRFSLPVWCRGRRRGKNRSTWPASGDRNVSIERWPWVIRELVNLFHHKWTNASAEPSVLERGPKWAHLDWTRAKVVTLSAGQHYLEPANGHERTRRGEEGGGNLMLGKMWKNMMYIYIVYLYMQGKET